MKLYNDINSYYPKIENDPNTIHDDFRIFRLENMKLDDEDWGKLSNLHRRSFFEFSIVQEDIRSAEITIGKDRFHGLDNHVFFTSPNQVFSIDFSKRKKEEKATGFLVAFKPSFLIDEKRDFQIMNAFSYYNSHTSSYYTLKYPDLKEVFHLMNKIYSEYSKNYLYSKDIIKGYLHVLLHNFNRILQTDPNRITSSSANYIASQFEQKIIESGNVIGTIQELASELNVSPNYLSACVKNETNKSANEIILSHKLIVAKSLLSQSDKSVANVAYEMGYTEPTNFTKFFKHMAGVTPNEFRKNNFSISI